MSQFKRGVKYYIVSSLAQYYRRMSDKSSCVMWVHWSRRLCTHSPSRDVKMTCRGDIHLLSLCGESGIAKYFSCVRWYLVQMEAVGDKLLRGMWPASSLCTLCRVVCPRLQTWNFSNRGQTRRTSSGISWFQNGKSRQLMVREIFVYILSCFL